MQISHSDRRPRHGASLLAGAIGLVAVAAALATSGPPAPGADPAPGPVTATLPGAPSGPFLRVGMGSCAARGCHGAVAPTDPSRGDVFIEDGQYTTWRSYDPHSRAYAVLLEGRSDEIARKMEKTLGTASAREAKACLACHAPAGPGAVSLTAGVSCEACHGPAQRWKDLHLATAWRARSADVKARDGLTDLSGPAARAASCVSCHVGDRSAGMDVNHDLIAAGHPRLNFEYASYLASYPKHWREAHEKTGAAGGKHPGRGEFEARSWAVGQAVTARAALGLLADRARDSRGDEATASPWPEFAESECFACHHDLTSPSWRQAQGPAGRRPGQIPWSSWFSAMLPGLAQDHKEVDLSSDGSPWRKLGARMQLVEPDAKTVEDLAGEIRKRFPAWIAALEAEPWDGRKVEAMARSLSTGRVARPESWDAATQRYLALAAMGRASDGYGLELPADVVKAIDEVLKDLDFPSDFNSPRGYRPTTSPAP